MNVGEMRLLLKGLPKDMPVLIDMGEGLFGPVCAEKSDVLEIPVVDDDEDFENDDPVNDFHEYDINEDDDSLEILLLVPCNHVCDVEQGELNSQPELN